MNGPDTEPDDDAAEEIDLARLYAAAREAERTGHPSAAWLRREVMWHEGDG